VVLIDSLFKALRADSVITADQLIQGFNKILEIFSDVVVDTPKAPRFMGILIGGALSRNHLPMTFLHSFNHLISEGIAPQLGLEIFDVIRQAKSDPQTENEMWEYFPKLFKPNTTESQLITYLIDKKMSYIFPSIITKSQIESMIKDGSSVDSILKWIEHNAPNAPVDASFARWLIRTVLKFGSTIPPGGDETKIIRYADLLSHFISSSLDIQLQCIFEVQGYWAFMGEPKEILPAMFSNLYDKDVILEDAFKIWIEDCKDPTPKKEEAVLATSKFMNWLETASEESEEEDEKERD